MAGAYSQDLRDRVSTRWFAAFNAPRIAATIAASASGQSQTLDPATPSSMTGARASVGFADARPPGASSASTSADARACPRAPSRGPVRCTRPRSNASARAKPIRPYEFGVKVSLATTQKGGQFIAHAKALPGNPGACLGLDPRDGHTLQP